MRGRSRAGSVKSRRRKPAAPKRSGGTKPARPRSSSAANQESEIARLAHDLNDALERETAASEILNIISSAQAASVQPVLDTVVTNAGRLCRAFNANIYIRENDSVVVQAQYGPPGLTPPVGDQRPINRRWVTGAAVLDGRTIHISDLANGKDYPDSREIAQRLGTRTTLAVPLMRDKAAIGVIIATRREVHPFSKTQIALLQNFAAQAVIAIENARLLSELRESLQRQTATADILRVIASTPEDSKHALDTIAETASHMFGVANVNFRRIDGDVLRIVSSAGPTTERLRKALPDIRLEATDPAVRCFLDNRQIPIEDRQAVLINERGAIAAALRELPVRSQVFTPLSRQGKAIGVMIVTRGEVQPFQERELELMKGFADQAVIAIENTRLFNELRQRTVDLSESLEQQTATSEVLNVISSSPGELEPVFQTILEKAVHICDANFGNLFRFDGEKLHPAAEFNTPAALLEALTRRGPFKPTPDTSLDRVTRTKKEFYSADMAAEPVLGLATKFGGARSQITVPMLKDDALIGAILIYRQEVRPFSDKQIALVQNFAAQAVIAIENARLLNELRQSLERQTATADVLRVISSSPGSLEPVFQAMLENAVRICDAKFGILWRYDNEAFDPVALFGAPEGLAEFVRQRGKFQPSAGTALDLILRTKEIVRIDDAMKEPALGTARRGGARSLIIVPMLKDNALIGAITIYRQEVKPFTNKQVELIKNFAAQAVIAIENARLLKELRERTDQLEEQSQEVVKLNQQLERRVADQVGEIERMSKLRRFLPPQVADLIVASGTEKQLESHRREITALFCDLRGFTGFSESSDPEDVMALLRDYHAAIGEIIVKYSGTLERFAGDGVMVIFNDPVPVENPALQAVLMALDMRTAIGAMIEKYRLLGHDLGFGIGIAHGFATLGTIGFEGRYDYAAIGTVSNVASRLCDEAKPGQILISPRVMLAVDKTVTVEPVGEFELKGIRRPMAAYNVLASSSSKPN